MAFIKSDNNNYDRVEASVLIYDNNKDILNQRSVKSIKNHFNRLESKHVDDRVDNEIDANKTTDFTGKSIGISPSKDIYHKYDKFNQRLYDKSNPRRNVFDRDDTVIALNSIFTLTRLFLLILFLFIVIDFVKS
jgi:hypothetical protein